MFSFNVCRCTPCMLNHMWCSKLEPATIKGKIDYFPLKLLWRTSCFEASNGQCVKKGLCNTQITKRRSHLWRCRRKFRGMIVSSVQSVLQRRVLNLQLSWDMLHLIHWALAYYPPHHNKACTVECINCPAMTKRDTCHIRFRTVLSMRREP